MDEELREEVGEFIRAQVASGFSTADEIMQSVQDSFFEAESDYTDSVAAECEAMMSRAVEEHLKAEASWGPAPTDNDRLIEAFKDLEKHGIVARENWTCCQNCGHSEIGEEIDESQTNPPIIGYTFYHQQDTDAAVEGHGIMLAYGATAEANELEVPKKVVDILSKHGFHVEWNGSTSQRIAIPTFSWRRRAQLLSIT